MTKCAFACALALLATVYSVNAASPCTEILRAAGHHSAENEEKCKARVEHDDIGPQIRKVCLPDSPSSPDKKKWQDFKAEYSKTYNDSLSELLHCISFQDNLRRIQLHKAEYDAGRSNYFLKVTEFADQSDEEFRKVYLGPGGVVENVDATDASKYPSFTNNPPEAVDWRQEGYVTPAGNQGPCGSCWAFAAVGVVEGQYFKKTGQLKKFSEQELVDCTYDDHNGCQGGYEIHAYNFIKMKGIALLRDYPFVAKYGQCRQTSVKSVTKVSAHHVLPADDEGMMKKALATVGPVVTCFFGQPQMRLYGGGVFDLLGGGCDTPKKINHAVLVVGYGTTDKGLDYWIVKNSIGPKWGENGFFKVPRGSKYCSFGREVSMVEIQ